MFPPMEGEEFEALVADIKKHGLRVPITTIGEGDDKKLLDGRNRERACIAAGIPPLYTPFQGDDPVAFVISANIHRRHLPAKQKRDLIAKLLKATPEKSNRQIAGTVKADHKTVASVRAEKEATGEIPQLVGTIGKDGRERKRSTSKPTTPKPKSVIEPAPKERVLPEALAPDEEISLLREFARFIIERAKAVSVDPHDHAEWKALRGRVRQMLGAA
jgi:ParB-like chromosome segregation protein Spo0J